MCPGLLAQTPDEPQEPKAATPLDQEFSINATIYSARAWLPTRFASASHAGKSIFPSGTIKVINLSADTITVTTSGDSDHNLKTVVAPYSEVALSPSSLSAVQASTSGKASKVTFLFHIFFSRDPGPAK